MNRRSFLWQGLCSSLPLLAKPALAQQLAPPSPLSPGDLAAFARKLTGSVFSPGDPSYEKLRRGYASWRDAHPALVVHPVNPEDLQATLAFATSRNLPLAVRCGGHSYAGYSSCDGGVVVDMSGFRSIAIASDKSSARLGGGMLCGAVEIETAKAGLATVLGQCPSVGVGGFLLGGGVGPLMSPYGLGCDNVLAAELVLADGSLVKTSPHENPDLYWAIRGGGGNFGIVTAFDVALHPVSKVFAGNITLQSDHPGEFLRAFRESCLAAPPELTLIALLSAEPSQKPSITIEACYAGDPSEGEKVLAPLRRNNPAVVDDSVRLRPYLELEQMVPSEFPPSYEEHRSGFFAKFEDHTIDTLARAFSNPPFSVNCFLVHLHGAVTRIPVAATAFPLRTDGIAWDVAVNWKPPNGQPAAAAWITALNAAMPVSEYGAYVNVMDREGGNSVRRAYAANYDRLQHLKRRYDPQNVFALNQNIRP
jgi:FAD/FMN-containing dehydrogenase